MIRFVTLVLVGGLAMPSFAQEASEAMPCSEFLELGSEDQLLAVGTAQLGEGADQAAAADPDEALMAAVVTLCTARPDLMLGEAIAGSLDQ